MDNSSKGLEKFKDLTSTLERIGTDYKSEEIKIKYYSRSAISTFQDCDNILIMYSETVIDPCGEKRELHKTYIDIWKDRLIFGSYDDIDFCIELIPGDGCDTLQYIEDDQYFQLSLVYDLSFISAADINLCVDISRKIP